MFHIFLLKIIFIRVSEEIWTVCHWAQSKLNIIKDLLKHFSSNSQWNKWAHEQHPHPSSVTAAKAKIAFLSENVKILNLTFHRLFLTFTSKPSRSGKSVLYNLSYPHPFFHEKKHRLFHHFSHGKVSGTSGNVRTKNSTSWTTGGEESQT